MSENKTVLVTGASGHLGQSTLDALLKTANTKILATTRTPEKLVGYAQKGVEVRAADFDDPASLVESFRGVDELLLISTDALGVRMKQHQNAIEAAKKAGVRRIVYTSWPSPETSVALVAADHKATEKMIVESGLKFTILRNFPYADNLLMGLPNAVQMGTLYGSAGEGKVAFVTRDDCANTAAAALLSSEVDNVVLNVTGPSAVGYAEIAKAISELAGKEIPYVSLPFPDFKGALVKSGLPEMFADLLVSFEKSTALGETRQTSDTVHKLTGREPETVLSFLARNKSILLGVQNE